MATEAKNTNYWISSSALYIQLNAMGEPDYIQCSVVSGASILCYMQGIPGLEYDAGHNYQRWPLAAYPSVFPDSERKYIYAAIPRTSSADNNTAVVVYPSERIDLYGYSIANPDKLVGDERYYYIYLQGIISEVKTDADGKTRKRDWLQHVDCGKLNTDESLSSGIDGTWWKYNSVTDSISFLKTILSAIFDTLTAKVAKITKLFLGGSELNGVANDLSLETDNTKVVTPLYLGQFGVKHFLAKDKDDVAHGAITFEKVQKFLAGLNVGDSNSENGGSWTPDAEGRSHLITDYLEVRMKAIFEELVIKKTSTIGGKEIISPAGGVVAHKVEEVTVTYNNVSQKAYRCYFLAEQEGDSVDNDFAVNDQVRSESFNVRKGTYHKVGNHFYWRLVIGRDEDPVEVEGKKYHYIDLSDTDCATASDVPAKGDVLSQCGNRTDIERQNCLIFSAVDTYSPSISLYHGINSYSFANKEYVEYGVNKQTNKAFFNVYGDMYVGDRPTKENGYEGSSYIKYDSAAKQVSIKGKLSAKSTVDGKELSQYIKDNSAAGLTEEQVNNLINNSQVIADLQNQVDGAIETWFYEGVPTLTNAPASSWTTDKDKDTHLGDLYYDNKTGKAYRFAKDGNTYKWTIITDTDIAKALSDASKAQETANGKMTVFSTQPTPPYQVGDIWVNATYPANGSTYKNEVLRCQTDKKAGSQFAIADWIKASKYTDDTVANAAKKAAEDAQKAAQTAQTNVTKLGNTVTDNKKSFDNYVKDGYLEPSEIAAMAQDSKRLEDDFAAAEKSYNEVKDAEVLKGTKELTDLNTAFATLTTAKKELIKYLSDISARYNAADTNGKATIVSAVETKFTNFQSAYSAFYDKLGLANAYITSKIYVNLGVVIGDVTSLAYLKKALMDTPDTEINGGLVLTSLIGLRDTDGNTTAGINGITEKSAKGGGVAAWFGGEMVDNDYNDGSKTPANTIFRFDGSGYVAGGAIWWGTDGRVHADPTSFIISEKNLGAYLTFFEPTWKAGSAGTSVADLVSLKPNAPFTKLGVSGDATFEGAISFHGIKLTYDATNKAIKVDGNLYATGGITAYGASSVAGGGGGLNGSVKAYADAIKLTTENLSEIASAYSVAKLYSEIQNVASAVPSISVSVPTGGNALTGATYDASTGVITFTKGTFLTAHQSLASYYTKAEIDAKGYTTNKGTVTSVGLTLPTGLVCATKTITTSGTFAVTFASGYSIPTTTKQTAWDGAVSAKHTHSNKSVLDGITSAKVTHWDSAYDWYALMTTNEETADGIINKWNEVVSFLANIAQTDTLSGIVDGINKSISDEVTRAKKAEGVNASGISTNKTNITTLQGYFTSGSAKKALQLTNARKLWGNSFNGTADINGSIIVPSGKYISIGNIKMEYDATNKALKITNTTTNEVANLYTSGGVSAYGVGTSSSSGGGLNGSVKSYSDALKLTSESLSEIASAYSIKQLSARITSLEGGSATSISVSGSGNAVTSVTKNGTTISVVKGSTFLTSHQILDHIISTDKRSTVLSPTSYLRGVYPVFISNTTDGLLDGGEYHGVLHWRSYGQSADDLTGVYPIQIAYTANGRLWTRIATSKTTWGDWKKIARTEDIPTKLSQLTNDKGYLTSHQSLAGYATQDWVNAKGYITSSGGSSFIRKNELPTPANNTVKAYKDSLVKFFKNYPNGIGANVGVSASIISNWLNDAATYFDSSSYSVIKISGFYDGVTYGQFLLSSYDLSKVGIVGRNLSQWSKIKWLAYEDQIPTDNNQLANGAGYITSSGSCAYATSAGNAETVDGYYATMGNNKPWGTIPVITANGGYMDIGKHLEFHYDNSTGSDYSTALMCTGNHGNIVNLPSRSGTLALTSDIPTKVSQFTNDSGYITSSASITGNAGSATKLQTARKLWGNSFNGTADINGNLTGVDNITMSNNSYLYGKNTGGTAIQLIAMASWNSVDIGRGALVNGYTTQVMGKTVALTASDDSGKNVKSVELSTAKLYSNVNIETEGGLLAHGGVTAYQTSDERLKHDIHTINCLDIVRKMGGTVAFRYNADNSSCIGWIAQHVLQNPHLKDIVETDEKGYYKINYWSPKLIATAFGAIEQVGDEVSSLKARVVFLESEVQRLSGKQGSSNKKRLDNKNINLLN